VDLSGHGTHVAGIISEALQAAGVAHELLPVRCLDPRGRGQRSGLVTAIRWAAEHGARIINLSVVEQGYDAQVDAAVQCAWGHGALLVAAGGNTGRDEVLLPAGYPHVLGVAATDDAGRPWSGSTRGEHISLAAPGVNRRAAMPGAGCLLDPYGSGAGRLTGSSQAAALVTAVAAQLWSRHPGRSNRQLYADLLRLAATGGEGWEPSCGYGVISGGALQPEGGLPHCGGLVVQTDAPTVRIGDDVLTPGPGGIVRVRNLPPGGYEVDGREVRVDAGTDTLVYLPKFYGG
jgi:subtilisin family serine protease